MTDTTAATAAGTTTGTTAGATAGGGSLGALRGGTAHAVGDACGRDGADGTDRVESDLGPLAGVHAALVRSESMFNLITPVDMPLLTSNFLEAFWASIEGRFG